MASVISNKVENISGYPEDQLLGAIEDFIESTKPDYPGELLEDGTPVPDLGIPRDCVAEILGDLQFTSLLACFLCKGPFLEEEALHPGVDVIGREYAFATLAGDAKNREIVAHGIRCQHMATNILTTIGMRLVLDTIMADPELKHEFLYKTSKEGMKKTFVQEVKATQKNNKGD